MARGIPGEHPDLTIFDLAQGATVLPCDSHGVLPFFDKARLIEHQHAIRVAHLLGYKLMVVPHHLLLIPDAITDKPLQPTDGTPLNLERHGLNRLAFKLTELAYHVVKEMGARFTAWKTVVKGRLKLLEFVHEAFHITGHHVKRGNGKTFAFRPTGW